MVQEPYSSQARNSMEAHELSTISPKTLGQAASDFEELKRGTRRVWSFSKGKRLWRSRLYRASHAYRDGLRAGDIILSLDGRSFGLTKNFDIHIQTKTELGNRISSRRNGPYSKDEAPQEQPVTNSNVCLFSDFSVVSGASLNLQEPTTASLP